MLSLPLIAAAFVFKLLGRQYWRTLARPQLLFFNRYLVSFLGHLSWTLSQDFARPRNYSSKMGGQLSVAILNSQARNDK
jgi:hypothetical protein